MVAVTIIILFASLGGKIIIVTATDRRFQRDLLHELLLPTNTSQTTLVNTLNTTKL